MVSGWGWPFPEIGEGKFEGYQLFGKHPGGEFRQNGFHNGLDFGTVNHPGKEIHAVHEGKVIYANWAPAGYGELGTVVVTKGADGFYVVYQEFGKSVNDIRVKVGNEVVPDQIIANRTTDHMHLGITKKEWLSAQSSAFLNNGTWLDPKQVIKQPIENTRTKHNVVTFWYPANSYGANRVIDYCKSKNHSYKIITGADGRWMISVGTFFQNSRYKFTLEKFLAENSMNYTVELAGSGTALREGNEKVASSENRHSVATYWYNKGSSGYNQVINYCKVKGWNYKLQSSADGRVKFIIGTFLQVSDNKFDLMIFLGDANYSFDLELSQYK